MRVGTDGAPWDAPRRGEGWHGTAPQEYTEWCRSRGVEFARTVKALKRWRDENQGVRSAIKSIVLQVLIAEAMPSESQDGRRLAETLAGIVERLDPESVPVVRNPVLPSEDLAARWDHTAYSAFVSAAKEAADAAKAAVDADDDVEAVELWRSLLGEDFPPVVPASRGVRLGADDHALSFSDQGWREQLDPRFYIEISATHQRGRNSRSARPYPNNGHLLFKGTKLRFRAKTAGPSGAQVWWQVANTGAHARDEGSLRGSYFKARTLDNKPSEDALENWENTEYTGTHWIRAVLVRDTAVVAATPKFLVNIYSPRYGYRR